MFKTIATAIVISLAASTAHAGFFSKLHDAIAYGGKTKEQWTQDAKTSAGELMEKTGKSFNLTNNNLFVKAGDKVVMIPKTKLANKSKTQIQELLTTEIEAAFTVEFSQDSYDTALAAGASVEDAKAFASLGKDAQEAIQAAGKGFDQAAAEAEAWSEELSNLVADSGATNAIVTEVTDSVTKEIVKSVVLEFESDAAMNNHFNNTCKNGGCFDPEGNEITSLK